jgi:hypothetical protein
MWNDPIVEETRKIRAKLAARFNYDVQALGRHYQAQQRKERRAVVTRAPKRIAPETTKAAVTSKRG